MSDLYYREAKPDYRRTTNDQWEKNAIQVWVVPIEPGRLVDRDTIQAGITAVLNAAFAMRQSGISLMPRHQVAVTFSDGIQRLSIQNVLTIGLDAMSGIGSAL